jgi:type II secretion system protein H
MKSRVRLKGFTLLELLVVIVILSVMVSILIPSLGTRNRNTINAAESLVLMINMAQQEAIMTSRVWQMVFDTNDMHYRFQQLGNVEFEDITTRPLAGDHNLAPALLDELEINGQLIKTETAELYLYPTGEQDSLRLVLKSDDAKYAIAMGPVGPAELERL